MSSFEINYEEDLIPRIRDLIDGYDKDSILKEYLQNADDSGATELIVTFDKQNYKSLNDTKYEKANSNALLIYNNSQFTENDFNSIIKISAQGKTDDPNSTGRFGQGFSSSFSISDYPSFVSNDKAYWFDVLRNSVSQDKEKSIQGWNYKNSNEIDKWMATFKVAGFNQNFNETIFRLPLRNKKTSKQSKISNEIFTFDDFLKWVNEWKNSSENLLFLRHIHRLILKEVDENGKHHIHLEIKTKNSSDIEKINNKIQKEFDSSKSLLDLCEKWETNEYELPLFKYKHLFEIKYFNRETHKYITTHKTYAVANGLFRGENNSLIKYAKKVLNITPNPRKVLPWSGVAVEIDSKNNPIKNNDKLFTFLPLPIKSNYSVHIHGWFDLNPKRTEITSSGSGYDKEILIEWNKLLLKHGTAKAWAELINFIKQENSPNYQFWAKDTEFNLNNELIEGFYQYISELDCFYTNYKTDKKWYSPKKQQLYYLDHTNQLLLESFKEEFKIIIPKPPKYIIENFKKIGIKIIDLNDTYIRTYLANKSETMKFPQTLEDIDIPILRKKEWLIEVIKYCANDGEDYSLLDSLPIELTIDNNIYKVGSKTLFDNNQDLKLFQNMKYLFIDIDVVKSIDNIDTLPKSWLLPTLKNKLSLLLIPGYWKNLTLSKDWIEHLIKVITDSSEEEIDKAIDEIQKLEIVYQENGEYGSLKSEVENFSAFMPREEDLKNNLDHYKKIGMNTIHHEYINIYKPLLKYNGLITKLNSETLIQHLLLLDDFDFFKDDHIRNFLLDILADDLSWFENLNEYQKLKLNSMPFFETVSGNIYSKDAQTKLFLPTDFSPPEHIKRLNGEYELIAVEVDTKLFRLFKKMDIEEQNIDNYIQNIIVPFLKGSENITDKKEILKWLSKEWDNIKKDNKNEKTLDILKKSPIIPTLLNEKELLKASELYLPTVSLDKVLNDNFFRVISFSNETEQEKWILFLKDLGASETILPKHIIKKVQQITAKEDQRLAIDLLNYISNKFEIFEDMQYDNTPILSFLQTYAWYPVKNPIDILKPKSPYSKLKKSNELILLNDYKIAGGYYHVLHPDVKLGKKDEDGEYTEKVMAEKLGIITNIPNKYFFKSFRELIELSPINGQVINCAKEAYAYMGRRFKGECIDDFDKDEKIILIN